MGNHILVAYLLCALVVQAMALPIAIRDVVGDNHGMSASVIEGIVIGIVILIFIPVLWHGYKMCHRNQPGPTPVFAVTPPIYITNTSANTTTNTAPSYARIDSSSGPTLPQKAHAKVNAPTSGA